MGPLAEHKCESSFELKYDSFLKPNHSFTESHGKLRLSVRFLECHQYRDIPSRSDLTKEEINQTWYSEEEYRSIKAGNIFTLRLLTSGTQIDPDNYCVRGLECRTAEGWQQRVRNKMTGRRAVLQEQEVQKSEGMFDPDLLEQVSSDASYRARMEARDRALDDELAVLIQARSDHETNDPQVDQAIGGLSYFSFY